MAKSVPIGRTTDLLVELAEKYAPQRSQELSVLLRETAGDMECLQELFHQPPEERHAGQLIADIKVDLETLTRKCHQLVKVLDRVRRKIPGDASL
jgi:hypothetical protein